MEVKIHNTLNPKIWEQTKEKRLGGSTNYMLKPEVASKLRTIAQAFIGFLEIPNDAVKDIRLLGSSANYNYTKHSDIDLHIVVDFNKVHKDCPVVEGYLHAQKSLFNKEHDIFIYNIPVELYAESTKDKTASNGIYSLKENKWLSKPTKPKVEVEDLAIKSKFEELKRAIEETKSEEESQGLIDKLHRFRKAGLAEAGEFSVENIVYKKLRDAGLLDKLKANIKDEFDKKLSLKESNTKDIALSLAYQYALHVLTRE